MGPQFAWHSSLNGNRNESYAEVGVRPLFFIDEHHVPAPPVQLDKKPGSKELQSDHVEGARTDRSAASLRFSGDCRFVCAHDERQADSGRHDRGARCRPDLAFPRAAIDSRSK